MRSDILTHIVKIDKSGCASLPAYLSHLASVRTFSPSANLMHRRGRYRQVAFQKIRAVDAGREVAIEAGTRWWYTGYCGWYCNTHLSNSVRGLAAAVYVYNVYTLVVFPPYTRRPPMLPLHYRKEKKVLLPQLVYYASSLLISYCIEKSGLLCLPTQTDTVKEKKRKKKHAARILFFFITMWTHGRCIPLYACLYGEIFWRYTSGHRLILRCGQIWWRI